MGTQTQTGHTPTYEFITGKTGRPTPEGFAPDAPAVWIEQDGQILACVSGDAVEEVGGKLRMLVDRANSQPDLLAACKALADQADYIDLHVLNKSTTGLSLLREVQAARAAIAKAGGA